MQEHLEQSMNLARIKLMTLLLEALVKAQTVNLVRLANAIRILKNGRRAMSVVRYGLRRLRACYKGLATRTNRTSLNFCHVLRYFLVLSSKLTIHSHT